jgi:excisionase family DNA binding protein
MGYAAAQTSAVKGRWIMEQLQFPELVDIETVAKLLDVGERYVRRMVAERRVPTVKIGHFVRFDLADIRRFVEEHRRPEVG